MCEEASPAQFEQALADDTPSKTSTVLIIGRIGSEAARVLPPDGAPVVVGSLGRLTAQLVDKVAPEMVVLPLMANGQDAVQVITRLDELSYAGQVVVLAPTLPDPAMVERELRATAPGLRLRLVMPPQP
jgi:hypothetical protein